MAAGERRFFEGGFGVDFSGVRIHDGATAARAARHLSARAFADGPNIGFADGEFRPGTAHGKRLLAHELAHVALGHTGIRLNGDGPDDRIRAPEPEPPTEDTPFRPSEEWFYFRGYTVTADADFMHGELRRLVAERGLGRAADWVSALAEREGRPGGGLALPFSAHVTGYGVLRPRSPLDAMRDIEREEDRERLAPTAIPVVVATFREVRTEAEDFIATFEGRARDVTTGLLDDSAARAEAERLRYGLSRDTHVTTRTHRDGEGGWVTDYDVRVTDRMEDTLPGRGLAGAAQDLIAKNQQISLLYSQQSALMESRFTGHDVVDILPSRNIAAFNRLRDEIQEKSQERNILRGEYQQRYPILGRLADDNAALRQIANGHSAETATVLNDQIYETLDNIAEVRRELAPGGRVNVWKLPEIVTLTKSATGARDETSLGRMKNKLVDDKVTEVESDEFWLNLALGVVIVALAGLAAIPTGGSSLAAGATALAGIGGAGLSIGVAASHLEQFMVESAMAGTDFDRARAISASDPSLFWLAVDIIGALADVGTAVRSVRTVMSVGQATFRTLSSAARRAVIAEGAEATEALAELRRLAAESEAAQGASGLAGRVVGSVERIRGAGGSVERALGGAAGHEAAAVARGVREIESAASHALARAPTRLGGHTVSVLPNGWIVRCSVCGTIRAEFAFELARSPQSARRVFEIEDLAARAASTGNRELAERAAAEAAVLADELEAVRRTRDIRLYRGVPQGAIDDMYLMDNRLVVEMPFIGRGASSTNAAGWLRDADYYWQELGRIHPDAISEANWARIRGDPPLAGPVAPVNDATFRRMFPQYDVRGLRGQPLIHHHIGGGGQSVAIPAPLHQGFGGIHNMEREAGIWGGEDLVADVLQRLLENVPP